MKAYDGEAHGTVCYYWFIYRAFDLSILCAFAFSLDLSLRDLHMVFPYF